MNNECALTVASLDAWRHDHPGSLRWTMRDVTVVIPTLNEERNLPYVLGSVPDDVGEVLIVDGRSEDRTVEVAQSLRRDLRVVYDDRPGKGYALQTGFAASQTSIIVMIDADGSMTGEEIQLYVDAIARGADFVKGSRHLPDGGSSDLTWLRRTGNTVLTHWTNLWFGTAYTDLCYGYIGFRRDVLPALDVDCGGFEVETLMNIRAKRAGLVVEEVPSFESDRLYGESHLHVVRDGWRIFKTLMRERFGLGSGQVDLASPGNVHPLAMPTRAASTHDERVEAA